MLPPNELNRRLTDFLRDPRENLDIELKGWLDLRNNEEHKAIVAKAIIALGNHGGGIIILGFNETQNGVTAAEGRPENLSCYTPDHVNSIVSRYVEPPFHCDIQLVTSPSDGLDYPVITVPGGHQFPLRSRRDGPGGQTIRQNVYYTRRPGPQSEPPQSGQEWDKLLRGCIANARDELLDSFRVLMSGGAPAIPPPEAEVDRVSQWFDASVARWEELATQLPTDHPARMQHGHYAVGYQLFFDNLQPRHSADLLASLQSGVVRLTGWPPFWVPSRQGIAPYMYDGNVECWLGQDGEDRDSAHADFWRASPSGQFFLLRGYQEDGPDKDSKQPGEIFDLTIPVWRMGEILLHAASMANQFGAPSARIVMVGEWTGLSGRRLASWANKRRMIHSDRIARQQTCRVSITVRADAIRDTLPELVTQFLRPVYELFDFFQLPENLVVEELARMRAGRSSI